MTHLAHSGLHLMANLSGVDADLLIMRQQADCRDMCLSLVKQHGLQIVGDYFYAFAQGGVTGVVVLAESHVAIHTWPEANYVTLDVFVCNYAQDNTEKARALFEELIAQFKPTSTKLYEILRD